MVRSSDAQVSSRHATVDFRLCAGSVEVDVSLRRYGDRWIAVTQAAGAQEIGLSATPRGALAAAVRHLRPRAAAALLADVQLLGVTLRLA